MPSAGISQIPGVYCFSSQKLPKNKKPVKKDSQNTGVYTRGAIIKVPGAADDRRLLVPDSVISHRSGPGISSSHRLPEKKQVDKKVIRAVTGETGTKKYKTDFSVLYLKQIMNYGQAAAS